MNEILSFIDGLLGAAWYFPWLLLMALSNLLGIMLLRKDMKQTVNDYWRRFDRA